MTTSQSSTPTLLVPVALEALVVNNPVKANVTFSRWSPAYENLNNFQSPIPPPFNTQGGGPSNGVYLHWVLPDTFAHGLKQSPASPKPGTVGATRAAAGMTEQQEIAFPHVPNRWLVVRIVPGTATATGTCRAWVVQSDYLDPNSSNTGANPFVDPFKSTPESVVVTTIGKTVDLDDWVEPEAVQLFLKAVGPASVTFSAYTPNVQDVFSVYDDLSDLPSGTDLTYVVMGWYSDPTEDLLYGNQYGANGWTTTDQWMALMQDLNWAIPASLRTDPPPPANILPKQSLCHGMIYSVQWQTQTAPNRVNSEPTKLQVAVGNKGIDAFTALLESVAQNSGTTISAELMEAFQYNLLSEMDQPDGAAQVAVKAEQAWFGSTPGGTLWQIVPVQRTDLTRTDQPQPQITPAQEASLAQLNQAQVQLDQDRRRLQSLQSQLHDIWWKQQYVNKNGDTENNPPPSETGISASDWNLILAAMTTALDATNPNSLISQVNQLQSSIASQAATLPDPHDPDSIAHYATTVMGLPSTLQLNAVKQPRFYQPSDPVLMIGGMEWPDRYIYGGTSDPNAALLTRLADQTITGLTVDSQTVTVSQMSQYIPMISTSGQSKLPSGLLSDMIALLQEAFLMDTGSAAVIAAHANGVTSAAVATAITNKQQIPTANIPASLAVTAWQQAWSPLFLEWQVSWLPTAGTSSTPGTVNWQFDGSDYNWTPANSRSSTNPDNEQSYSGRIFLSPHITFGFIARLQQYLKDNPNDPNTPGLQAIQKLVDQVGEWNFLSQTLSGLNDFLIMQDLDVTMPPDTSVVAQVGDQYDSFPYTAPGVASGSGWDAPPLPANYFFPIRAGHFCFEQLQVVDRFGQVLDLLAANQNATGNYESFYPIQGNGLVPNPNYSQGGTNPPSAKSYLKQPPRLVQPSRLEFNFVSANNDQQQSDLYADANPICGWVLPNHLDQSLALYDATGKLLGELLLVANGQGQNTLIWQADPGDPSPITPDQISNLHLKGFVQQLLALNDQGEGFEALFQVVDATLWKVDPLGGRGDQNLSVLIGRPLAIVRAKLQLMLEGNPVQDQAWARTCGLNPLNETTFDFTQVKFNVRLGSLDLFNDGLLGYFDADNYGQFNSVHSPTRSSPYITPIGQNNYITLPPNYLTQTTPQTTKFITMLLDPRGSIHATTGILPTQAVTLPDTYIGDAIKNLNVTFRVNGLLTDPDTIRIPVPSLKHADWSWIERSDPQTWNTSLPIMKANQKPRLASTTPVIHEGWLKLIDKEDSSN